MLLNRPVDAHQVLMKKSIDHWLVDPHAQIIKVVDADGRLVGWACWVLKEDESEQSDNTEKRGPTPRQNEAEGTGNKPPKTAEKNSSGMSMTQDPARILGGLMHKEMVKWEEGVLKGKKYLVLQALATDPSYQGRGIGTQLIRWGADKADAEGFPCWAHASPAGYSLYTRNGFKELGKSDFNLAEWAPGGEGGGRGWGVYTFRYMMRPVFIMEEQK